jgi:hypothetical protein
MNEGVHVAARELLAAHDALRVADEHEPRPTDDPAAWLSWRETESKPAYDRWSSAIDALADALGEPELSRHPFNFRPRCEAILATTE